MSPLIELNQIQKCYHDGNRIVHALRSVNATIGYGEMVAIMGPSGSGKSTLLHLLGLLDRPTEGDYRLAGRSMIPLNAAERARWRNEKIGFVFQSFLLIPQLTVLQNIRLPLLYQNVKLERANRAAEALLARFEITPLASKRPQQLSGGEKQRVALCRALVTQPDLILADEPTGSLDSENRERVMSEFLRLHQNFPEKTLIMVTHDPSVAAHCDRTLQLQQGELHTNSKGGA